MFKSKIKQNRLSREIGLGSERDAVGFGYIAVPSDIERVDYIQSVNKTGFAMIVTTDNEIITDAVIPIHILREMEFPEAAGIYGDCVSYITQPKTNQIVITGKLMRPGQSYASKEGVHVDTVKSSTGSISNVRNINDLTSISSVTNDQGSDGGQIIKSQGASKTTSVSVLSDGTLEVEADTHINLESGETLTVQIGSESDINTLKIDSDGVLTYIDRFDNEIRLEDGKMTIESSEILHGASASEYIALGNTLQTELNKSKVRIDGIIAGIQAAPTVTGDGGSSFKGALVGALSALIAEDYSQVLSTKNKVE